MVIYPLKMVSFHSYVSLPEVPTNPQLLGMDFMSSPGSCISRVSATIQQVIKLNSEAGPRSQNV
jgi:hypothetical protein